MQERSLIAGDILYILKNGFVYEDAEASTKQGFFKYKLNCKSPNSGVRTVRIIAIPDSVRCQVKIVTVMWVDA